MRKLYGNVLRKRILKNMARSNFLTIIAIAIINITGISPGG